ncbi:Hypothetical predicted protein [Mytilus galloprovincialis]|uniref:WSC domain-containing protein n=1 Tax=Mytilus galloprovincialis TaxID=29158 RepID=A0A8B6G330_MYTGA|nr:Hypothetical predicted protein [Mytilus galloprovincialis]
MKLYRFALFWILAVLFVDKSNGCNRSNERCFGSSRGYGFYFGTTNLACFNRGKRSPSVSTIRLTHRYLYYRGYYYEWTGLLGKTAGKTEGRTLIGTSPRRSHCNSETDYPAAGYGVLSTECVKGCARYYQAAYYFNGLSNNCHHFANWLADILCTRSTCPYDCVRHQYG